MALNLSKGEKLNLKKDNGQALRNICIGLNWGAIKSNNFFGFNSTTEAVDLDSSAAVFDNSGNLIDLVYFGKSPKKIINGIPTIVSDDGAIQHSGDDLTGDIDGDDGLDNEIISVQLEKIRVDADKIVFILNSFKGQDFATIPYAHLRIYEGTPKRVDSIFAKFNVAADSKFKNKVSMIMGKLYRYREEWKFESIGEPTNDRVLQDSIKTVIQKYL